MELNEYLSDSHKKRKKRRYQIFLAICVSVAVLIIVGILWIFLRSPLFRVNRFVVKGNSAVSDDAVIALADTVYGRHAHFGFLGITNMLSWPSSFSSSDLSLLPELSDATIEKNYTDRTITISVEERQPFAIWCSMTSSGQQQGVVDGAQCYWFDISGTMFSQAFDAQGSLILAVHDYSQSGLGIEKKIAPARFIPNIISILSVLRASGLRIKEIRLNDIGIEELQVSTYDGPDIYFSLRFPADDTFSVLRSLMTKPGFGKLQYVDLRTQDRAYYQ